MQHRKDQPKESFDEMIAYLDENGNLSSTQSQPGKKIHDQSKQVPRLPSEYKSSTIEKLTRTGTVSFFNLAKGFGFIKDSDSQRSVFVHASSLKTPIKENDKVSFQLETEQRGPSAVNVVVIV